MTGIEKIRDALIEVRDCGYLERFPALGNKIIKALEMIEEAESNSIVCIDALLETIEDWNSGFWEKEISDLDGKACSVINTRKAEMLINEYAEAYALKKCSECKDFCARARECCEDREGR